MDRRPLISSINDEHKEENVPQNDTNENKSANSSLDKMESLLVEEDEEENNDDLGTESLRMSDSEDNDEEGKKCLTKQIEDSEVAENKKSEECREQNFEKKKFLALIDSDSECEEKEESASLKGHSEIAVDDDSDVERISLEKQKKRRTQQIKDSSDEDDDRAGPNEDVHENEKNLEIKNSKLSGLIDSESELEELEDSFSEQPISHAEPNDVDPGCRKKKKSKGKIKKKPSEVLSDSDNEEIEDRQKPPMNIIDSDSDSSIDRNQQDENDDNKTVAKQRPKMPQRASAKKAMDEMQAIQSETQRLYRETQVNIPYHKPKRHTLKEFLTRRTISKPTLNHNGPGKSLKMTPEELEEYAKHLEERAKEATEFFKSESDDEMKDITDIQEIDIPAKESTEIPMETTTTVHSINTEVPSEAQQSVSTEEVDEILQDHEFTSQSSTREILKDLQSEPEPLATTSANSDLSNARPTSLTELKRRLLAEKNIPLVPKLQGDANMIIDFETGGMFARKPSGIENLFQRFMKSNKNNKKKPEETTPSQDLQTTLKVAVIQEPNKEKEPKPGAAFMKLKENLRTLISRKRKQEFQKKIEESKEEEDEYNKCYGFDEEEENEDPEKDKKKEVHKTRDYEIMIDDEENEVELEECENDKNDENDESYDDEGLSADENELEDLDKIKDDKQGSPEDGEDDESESSEEEENIEENPSTRKHRVIKAFQDSDDDTPDLTEKNSSILYGAEEHKNPEEVENELLGLCSGQFVATQNASFISQIPITQTPGNFPETQLEGLCSGVFNEESGNIQATQIKETQVEKPKEKTLMRIVSSDEEKEPHEDDAKSDIKKVKKLKKKRKKHVKLGFSDDEDDGSEVENSTEEMDHEEVDEEEIPQTFIDYDSEENEIEVQMSKKDCVKQANAFLEKEAELSESEWGSADEDEQNLDKYDQELGDEDEFDQQKLHTELEQIHMRKVLDDDIREVKKIQEMLFDDEEADGVGRQRKFRWKNIENGFSLDDPAGGGADDGDQVDSADDEEEMKWRKMRFEREQFLMQKSKEEILADVSTTEIGKKLLETMEPAIRDSSTFKIQRKEIVLKEYKKPSFLIKQNDLSNLRDSVLNYDKEVLEKIAESITKSGEYDGNDDDVHQKKASKTGNFVFRVLSEEEQEMRKRKADEEKNEMPAKKLKTSSKPLLLDRLL